MEWKRILNVYFTHKLNRLRDPHAKAWNSNCVNALCWTLTISSAPCIFSNSSHLTSTDEVKEEINNCLAYSTACATCFLSHMRSWKCVSLEAFCRLSSCLTNISDSGCTLNLQVPILFIFYFLYHSACPSIQSPRICWIGMVFLPAQNYYQSYLHFNIKTYPFLRRHPVGTSPCQWSPSMED